MIGWNEISKEAPPDEIKILILFADPVAGDRIEYNFWHRTTELGKSRATHWAVASLPAKKEAANEPKE